jgi:hypothetical protein
LKEYLNIVSEAYAKTREGEDSDGETNGEEYSDADEYLRTTNNA